jgi:hypothetical protein
MLRAAQTHLAGRVFETPGLDKHTIKGQNSDGNIEAGR